MTKLNRQIVITAIPIVGVNLTATLAQLEFWREHLPSWGIAGQLLFACSLESVAVMLCYFAHLAMVSNDSAFKLRLGAILFALVIATMNGSHYLTATGAITAASVGVFACSAMSPVLWGVFSKRQSRDVLLNNGLIEGRSVRLGSARWTFHPRKSFKAFSLAVWHGEQSPQEAISAIESAHAMLNVPLPTLADMTTKADAVRFALRQMAADSNGTAPAATDAAAWLQDHADGLAEPGWQIPASYVRDIMRRDGEALARQRRSTVRAIESGDSPRTAAGT